MCEGELKDHPFGQSSGSPLAVLPLTQQLVQSGPAASVLLNPYSEEAFQRRRYVRRPWKEHWRPGRGGVGVVRGG